MAQILDKNSLREFFQSKFDLATWTNYLSKIFTNTEIRKAPEYIENSNVDEKGYYIGRNQFSSSAISENIGFFYYKIKNSSVAKKPVYLRKLLNDFVNPKYGSFDAVLVVFESDDAWRMSYISDIDKTDVKRFSYVFGNKEHSYNTAVERFYLLLSNNAKGIEDIKDAFSVEALTKEFYNELFAWYQWVTDKKTAIRFPENTKVKDDKNESLETKIIRLITRIIFVWFIKQKNLIPDCIFDTAYLSKALKDFDPNDSNSGNYYNAILQNLFFATLNRAIIDEEGNKRRFADANGQDLKNLYRFQEMFALKQDDIIKLFANIPFLNGGLFDCLDKNKSNDKVELAYYYDGFSRNPNCRTFIPNIVFFDAEKGLFPILNKYNFTIEENTISEQEVALDPELLGKVFENLLGAYNPETKESARKDSGSFYTPRDIVSFMVDQSLSSYLGNLPIVEKIFSSNFEYQDSEKEQYQLISDKLKKVKILDPACGSGAFPMGLLNRIVDILHKLNPSEDIYTLKLEIIENCIYGVDIQNIAIQISKLRFFISLICDCEKDINKENFGIPTLPNLETRFVVANSLISLQKGTNAQIFMEDSFIDDIKNKLDLVRHQYFTAKTSKQKRELKKRDAELRNQLKDLLTEYNIYSPEYAEKIASWDPYDFTSVASFFSPEWFFNITDGFDIVIGNPPYVSTKGSNELDKKTHIKEFGFTDDLYNLFTFKGLFLCKEGGVFSYIIPKTFWTIQTKRNMRDLILSKKIDYIFDTANPFTSVLVDTCIIQILNVSMPKDNSIQFYDGTENLNNPIIYSPIKQNLYLNSQNSVIFKPTELNLRIYELYSKKVKELLDKWWDKINSSKKIANNQRELEEYRKSLKPGDITLLGCLTEGGQGLATANNGKYIAVRRSTKSADNIIETRPKRLAEAIKKYNIYIPELSNFNNVKDFLNSLTEKEIASLFDDLKVKHGRDIFGKGYLYKIIDDSELANVNELTDEEKQNGIDPSNNYYVPYDKGDKDGNRWYLETPFAIAWSKDNVQFLKTDPNARYQGNIFYFREGFCWIDVNSTYLKARIKESGVFDVLSMSLFTMTDIPDLYYVSLINSEFISLYVDNFINNTSHFQINDARQLPIIIPNDSQIKDIYEIGSLSINIKKSNIYNQINNLEDKENELLYLQDKLDKLILELYSV